MYPICIECNYTSMITGQRSVRASVNAPQKDYRKDLQILEDRLTMFPSAKKMFDQTAFQNSIEFRQLGSIHKEGRDKYLAQQSLLLANGTPRGGASNTSEKIRF